MRGLHVILSITLSLAAIGPKAGLSATTDATASRRFENCLSMTAEVPVSDAVTMACPLHSSKARTPAAFEVPAISTAAATRVLATLNLEYHDRICAEQAPASEGALAAICALLGDEQRTLRTVQYRQREFGNAHAVFAPIRVSAAGVDRYVRHTLSAAATGGFRELAEAAGKTLASTQAGEEGSLRDELLLLQEQSAFLAHRLEHAGKAEARWRTVAAHEPDRADVVATAIQAMREASSPRATIEPTSSSPDRIAYSQPAGRAVLVNAMAQEAAAEYQQRIREAIVRLDGGTDSVRADVTGLYVAEIMRELTFRAGYCAIACSGGNTDGPAIRVPLPLSSDLSLAIELVP